MIIKSILERYFACPQCKDMKMKDEGKVRGAAKSSVRGDSLILRK